MTTTLAILLERIRDLDQDAKNDLFAVLLEMKGTESDEEMREIEQTIKELLYPQLSGRLVEVESNSSAKAKLDKWSRGVGRKIKELREERKLNQDDLARLSGLQQSHISRLENGVLSPSHKTLKRIAEALSVPVSSIDPGSDD